MHIVHYGLLVYAQQRNWEYFLLSPGHDARATKDYPLPPAAFPRCPFIPQGGERQGLGLESQPDIPSVNKPRGLYFSKALSEGVIFGGAYTWWEFCTTKTDWVSLQFEGKFKKHVLPYRFCLVSLRAISKYKPTGAYVWRGDLMEGFLPYDFGGLIFGGAYFQNFTVIADCVHCG